GVQIKTFAIKALIGASLGTRRFQRAGVDYCLLGSPERLEPIRMLAIDKQIIQARPIPAPLIPISAPRAETARWKRRVPRRLPIYGRSSLTHQPDAAISRTPSINRSTSSSVV